MFYHRFVNKVIVRRLFHASARVVFNNNSTNRQLIRYAITKQAASDACIEATHCKDYAKKTIGERDDTYRRMYLRHYAIKPGVQESQLVEQTVHTA